MLCMLCSVLLEVRLIMLLMMSVFCVRLSSFFSKTAKPIELKKIWIVLAKKIPDSSTNVKENQLKKN